MPSLETPPPEQQSSPEPPSEPRRPATSRGGGGRYSNLDTHELITLIDEIDDDRARARFREALYLAVILWLVMLLLYIFLPRWLPHAPVLIVQDRNPKELTYLDTPPDLKNLLKNHPSPRISERSTEAQTPRPTKEPRPPEPKAGRPQPPAPQPTPQQPPQAAQRPQPQQQAPPQQTPQQQAPQQPQQQAKVTPKTPTPPLVDSPAPSAQKQPNFGSQSSAGTSIANAAKNTRSGGEQGDYGSTGRGNTGQGQAGVQVLSDMQGVDFGRYLQRLLSEVRRNWLPLIPEECNSPLFKQGITGVRFTIEPNGMISAMNLDYTTHDVAIDRAAWGSIKSLGQAPPLPKEFHGPNLELRIEFRVNKDRAVQ